MRLQVERIATSRTMLARVTSVSAWWSLSALNATCSRTESGAVWWLMPSVNNAMRVENPRGDGAGL